MSWLFRSKSYGPAPPCPFFQDFKDDYKQNQEEENDEDDDLELDSDDGYDSSNPVSTQLFINPVSRADTTTTTQARNGQRIKQYNNSQNQFAILDIVVSAIKKSIVTCSVEEREDVSTLDIGWPTDVQHVSHVTFDRFNGFLGLPSELEQEVPTRVPSASAKVFGVSAKSMQCSYDDRGNSVPTILLMMQKQLYSDGGLKAEGIFRITAENSQEEFVREQLNKGVVPHGIDVHCLSGLIKAWFRELPRGVLDSVRAEEVMECNTEEDCANLVKLLPSTEASLLEWAINLMADVVQNQHFNKMNARNVAMVFAPNMTQMADPLTALIHAVQVMNLLKTLILKTLRERHEPHNSKEKLVPSTCLDSCPYDQPPFKSHHIVEESYCEQNKDVCDTKAPPRSKFSRTSTLGRIELNVEKLWKSHSRYDDEESISPLENKSSSSYRGTSYDNEHYWLRLRKGVRKFYRHPLFQFSKSCNKKHTD